MAASQGDAVTSGVPLLSIEHGERRRYFSIVTSSPDPLAVVVLIHGYRSRPSVIFSQWRGLVESGRFLVVIPAGFKGDSEWRSWNALVCCGAALRNKLDDVGLIKAIVEQVWAANASLARLKHKAFLVGTSNGGFLTQLVALNHARGVPGFDFLAGAVTVAAAQWDPALFPSSPVRRVPTLMMHGQSDPLVNFTGCCREQRPAERCCCGISTASTVPCTSSLTVFARWRNLNGCSGDYGEDERNEVPGGYVLKGRSCAASTTMGIYPRANHSLVGVEPSIVQRTLEFLEEEACLQLGGGGACGPTSASVLHKVLDTEPSLHKAGTLVVADALVAAMLMILAAGMLLLSKRQRKNFQR